MVREIKCHNCGSSARIKLLKVDKLKDNYEWIETYGCCCGCTIKRRVLIREELAYYKGTRIYYEHHH